MGIWGKGGKGGKGDEGGKRSEDGDGGDVEQSNESLARSLGINLNLAGQDADQEQGD